MNSCSTLRIPETPAPAFHFSQERFFYPRAFPAAMSDLPDVFMGELQAAGDGGDDASSSGGRGKFGPKRYTIHGGNQPFSVSERAKYRSRDIEVKRKIASAMDTKVLPARIRALRKSLGLNQKDFGNICGVKQVAISQWESGDRIPAAKPLIKMSELASAADRQWWRDRAAEQAGVEIETPATTSDLFQASPLIAKIPLINNPHKVGRTGPVTAADVERMLYFTSDLFPDGGKIEAVRIGSGAMVAIIDVSRQDADHLIGKMVAVRTVIGVEVRWLAKEDETLLLLPFQPNQTVKPMRYKGEWSIVGAVRWLGEVPSAYKPERHRRAS